MASGFTIRWGWLRAMYLYTLVGAGGFGFAMLFMPGALQSLLRFPPQDPVVLKLFGSFLFASGLIAIPALVFPLKFVPLLLVQLVYKPVWLIVAALPRRSDPTGPPSPFDRHALSVSKGAARSASDLPLATWALKMRAPSRCRAIP